MKKYYYFDAFNNSMEELEEAKAYAGHVCFRIEYAKKLRYCEGTEEVYKKAMRILRRWQRDYDRAVAASDALARAAGYIDADHYWQQRDGDCDY